MAKERPLLPLQYCHPLPCCIHIIKTCITFKILHTVTPTHLLWHFHHISHLSRHKIGDFSISICLFLCSHFFSSLGSMAHHCNDLAPLSLSTTLVWTWMPTAPSLHPNVELCQICTTGQSALQFVIPQPRWPLFVTYHPSVFIAVRLLSLFPGETFFFSPLIPSTLPRCSLQSFITLAYTWLRKRELSDAYILTFHHQIYKLTCIHSVVYLSLSSSTEGMLPF